MKLELDSFFEQGGRASASLYKSSCPDPTRRIMFSYSRPKLTRERK